MPVEAESAEPLLHIVKGAQDRGTHLFVALDENPPAIRIFNRPKGLLLETETDTLRGDDAQGYAHFTALVRHVDSGYFIEIRRPDPWVGLRFGRPKDWRLDTLIRPCGCRREYWAYRNESYANMQWSRSIEFLKQGSRILSNEVIEAYNTAVYSSLLTRAGEMDPSVFQRAHQRLLDSLVSVWARDSLNR